MNKLIYILLICLAVVCHANIDDVVLGPARNESVTEKYLLPSWVNMDDANESAFASGGVTEIQLNVDYHISYMGKTYSSLSVYRNGRIAFGSYSADLNLLNNPFVQPLNRNVSLGNTFKWKYFDGDPKAPPSDEKVKYIAFEFDRFTVDDHEYSLQVLFYTDGEVQVQLWQFPDNGKYTDFVNLNYDWAKPSIFNGYAWQSLDEAYPKTMSIVENGQVREGWVAKGFGYYDKNGVWQDGDIGVAAVYRDNENSQLVYEMGANPRAGALVAYDYSREHPVVGGIKSVAVNYNLSALSAFQPNFRIYNWFFDNVKVTTSDDQTTLAGYQYFYIDGTQPKLKRGCLAGGDVNLSSAINVSYTLNTNYFCKAWEKLSEGVGITSPYIENDAVRFHPAPAFKFQWKDNSYATMKFNSIVYSLNQRPMARFLPPKPEFYLATSTNEGGRILVENLEGPIPYWLYKGQKVKAEIRATVGSVIKSVKFNGVDVYHYDESLKEGSLLDAGVLGENGFIAQYFSKMGYKLAERISFNVKSTEMSMILDVEFAPCSGRYLDPVTPQMVKTTNFLDPENVANARKNSSAVIKGSFGETVQTQSLLIARDENGNPITNNYIVSAYYTDDFQQKNYSTSDFIHVANDFEYLDMACYECIKKANAYYDGTDAFDQPDALGYAYAQYEKRYGNAEGSNGTAYGIANASFDSIPNQAESWTIPVFSDNEFIAKEILKDESFKRYYALQQKKTGVAAFSLSVARDDEGRFTQTITNSKGLIVSTWRMVGDKEYIVKYKYDEFDRLEKVTPNGNTKLAISYKYNDRGQVIETNNPDRGISKIAYDKYGRIRFTQNAAQKARNRFSAKIYDDLGREIAAVEVLKGHDFSKPDVMLNAANYIPYNRTLYGMPDAQSLQSFGLIADAALVSAILDNMMNVREKDVGATFAYDADGNLVVAKMASYDRIGRKTKQWIVYTMAGMPAVELSYEYDQSEALTHSTFSEWNIVTSAFEPRAERFRSYDAAGRLLKIEDENHKSIATYEYTKNGNVKSKSYYDRGDLVYKKSILQDVHGRPTEITYQNAAGAILYTDRVISYANALVGRVTEAKHEWKNLDGLGNVTRSGKYSYDGDGRLTQVDGSLPGQYRYEGAEGQMTYKQEGSNIIETSFSDDHYRPAGFSVNGESQNPDVEYFKYDASGNVWYDKRARVAYRLNAAGLPEVAYVLSEGRVEPTLAQVNDAKNPLTEVDETMRMAYDDDGRRIWTAFHGAGVNYEIATMPGVGEYRAVHVGDGGNNVFALKRMDLVAGGFRDMSNNIVYFPITDVQGNIRGYATTAGLQSAYDYYAYGSADEIMRGTFDDNKRWQGKEYDEPIRKLYFGARYFDPFFGLWLSPDPAGQFANPYTYGGDPVNYVDPNGEWVHIVVGAIVGAVVGTVQGAIQCTAPGASGSCAKSLSGGFVGGAAVGAAAAATGGAVSGAIGGLGGSIIGGAAGGAVQGAGNYATQSMINGTDMNWGDAWSSTWKGAATGAFTGGLGNLNMVSNYAIFANMFTSSLEQTFVYGITNWREWSWSGFAASAVGGAIAGAIPGYQPVVGEGAVRNIAAEIIYTSARSSAVGYLSGGIGSVFSDGSWDNDAALSSAAKGAVGGAISAASKIALMGYAVPKGDVTMNGKTTTQVEIEKDYADKHGLVIGPYGSVRRSGGLIAGINKLRGANEGGISLGRNGVSWGNDSRTPAHEGIHYLQQVRYGTLSFYARTINDYTTYGFDKTYHLRGSMENEADTYAGIRKSIIGDHPGY